MSQMRLHCVGTLLVAFTRFVKQWNSLGSGGEGLVTVLRQETGLRSSSDSSGDCWGSRPMLR